MSEVLERLLQAHVRHELSQLEGQQLDHSVRGAVQALFAWFETVTLNDVVSRAQINGVIERYVIELRVSGGITELVGELSQLVLQSRRSAATRVQEILSPASYAEFADKLMSLEGVRRELIGLVARSWAFTEINAHVLSRSLLDMLTPSVFRGAFDALTSAWKPEIERRLAELFARYAEQHRARMASDIEQRLLQALNPESVRSLLDEIWDGVSAMQLSEAFALLGEQDLEDFVVLTHEFWLRYRKSEFFRGISAEMVDHLFDKYGDESLASLIDDMGVAEDMVSAELIGFLRPVVELALRTGVLEQALRARLASFYSSGAALAAVSASTANR